MAHITNVGIHHFGPIGTNALSKSAHQVESQINNAHRNRWPDFPSELNSSYIGYNAIIWPDGHMTQYRFVGEETAAQKGHNFDTLSICIAGNFTKGVEVPTFAQTTKLKNVLQGLVEFQVKPGTTYSFAKERVYPHRVLQPNHTSCYGDSLSDTWARDFVFENDEERKKMLITLIELYKKMLKLLLDKKQLGGEDVPCCNADVRG